VTFQLLCDGSLIRSIVKRPAMRAAGRILTAEMDKQLSDNFQPLDNSILEQNALVVNTGDKLILFDTGLWTLHLFGPSTGRL
jgi:hypothetical protein